MFTYQSLKSVGFTPEQSEKLLELKETLLTKRDLLENNEIIKLSLQKEIQETKAELQKEMQEIKADLQKEMQEQKSEMIKWYIGMGISILIPILSLIVIVITKLA